MMHINIVVHNHYYQKTMDSGQTGGLKISKVFFVCIGWVQIVLVGSKSFSSGPNNFGQV